MNRNLDVLLATAKEHLCLSQIYVCLSALFGLFVFLEQIAAVNANYCMERLVVYGTRNINLCKRKCYYSASISLEE